VRYRSRKADFSVDVLSVLSQVHPEMQISSDGMVVLNDIIIDLVHRIMKEALELLCKINRTILSSREILIATRLVLPGVLAKQSEIEGVKALAEFTKHPLEANVPLFEMADKIEKRRKLEGIAEIATSDPEIKREEETTNQDEEHNKSGPHHPLTFSADRMREFLTSFGRKMEDTVFPFMTAVAQCMCTEVLQLSGNCVRDSQDTHIQPRHINIAIRYDTQLDKYMQMVVIANGGTFPNIHSALLPTKPKRIHEQSVDF